MHLLNPTISIAGKINVFTVLLNIGSLEKPWFYS